MAANTLKTTQKARKSSMESRLQDAIARAVADRLAAARKA